MHQKWQISVFCFAIIFCGNQSLGKSSNNVCTKTLNQLIESYKQFEQCALKHAVPVTMCEMCVEPYVTIVQAYHDLTTTPDPIIPRQKCIDQFINHDTLNIVWKQYQNSRNLWNEAACSSCFVDACDPDKMSPTDKIPDVCKLNKNVIDIRNKTDDLKKCYNTSDSKTGKNCIDCLNEFNLIASQYKQLGESSKGICFDIVDQFNQTSNVWYGEKHCPRPIVPSNTVGFIVAIIFMCLFTVGGSIAGGYFLFTKYRQRGLLNYAEQTDESDNGTATPPIYS